MKHSLEEDRKKVVKNIYQGIFFINKDCGLSVSDTEEIVSLENFLEVICFFLINFLEKL